MHNMLASFACDPRKSKGRLHEEKPTSYRNAFQRDKDRIIHANAFRRLEYKTQVFVNHEGDHYRNRLTHSIEVASIARSVAFALNLSPDLAETIALAHDIGHPPFGHAGEEALNTCMEPYGGFCHNAQAIKILTKLEQRYGAYDGLNLTWEVLEGTVKHNGPLTGLLPRYIIDYNKKHDLDLENYSSAEAQISALADDIAYHGHDIEDAVRAGLINMTDLRQMGFISEYLDIVYAEYPEITTYRAVYELIRHLNHYFVDDLLETTKNNISGNNIETIKDIRSADFPIVQFSIEAEARFLKIKKFLFDNVYLHDKVKMMTFRARRVVKELFEQYMEYPESMPPEWNKLVKGMDDAFKARTIGDYIAGMTDRYALKEFQTFCNLQFDNTGF